MIHLILLLLQTGSLDDAAAAFAKGDKAAREQLVKAGVSSILPLRKVRDRAPEPVDALLFDLKKAAAGAAAKPLVTSLDGSRSMEVGQVDFAVVIDDLSNGLPLLFDPALFRTHWQKRATLNLKDRPRREILESFCRQMDLDYGFFYGVVLIAEPGRLWPSASPPRIAPLTVQESDRAVQLIPRLSSDKAKERDEAYGDLKKLGTGAIPLLERESRRLDGEGQARCAGLIKEIQAPPPEGTFHVPAAARQKLGGGDDDLRFQLQQAQVSFKVQDIVLDGAMRLMLMPRQIQFELAPSLKDVHLTLDLQNHSMWAVLGLATHCCGFDFLILDGKVVIDRKEEIQRRLAK